MLTAPVLQGIGMACSDRNERGSYRRERTSNNHPSLDQGANGDFRHIDAHIRHPVDIERFGYRIVSIPVVIPGSAYSAHPSSAGYGNCVHIINGVRKEDISRVRIIRESPVSTIIEAMAATNIFAQIPIDLIRKEVVKRTKTEVDPDELMLAKLMMVYGAQCQPSVAGLYLVSIGVRRLDPRIYRF